MRAGRAACLPLLAFLLAGQQDPIADLRSRAQDILGRVERQELELPEARKEVEELRRSLIEIGKRDGWTPTRRALEMPISRPDRMARLNFDDCPLFYEEELVELCPLDLGRSEIWGNRVIVCDFLCAPPRSSSD